MIYSALGLIAVTCGWAGYRTYKNSNGESQWWIAGPLLLLLLAYGALGYRWYGLLGARLAVITTFAMLWVLSPILPVLWLRTRPSSAGYAPACRNAVWTAGVTLTAVSLSEGKFALAAAATAWAVLTPRLMQRLRDGDRFTRWAAQPRGQMVVVSAITVTAPIALTLDTGFVWLPPHHAATAIMRAAPYTSAFALVLLGAALTSCRGPRRVASMFAMLPFGVSALSSVALDERHFALFSFVSFLCGLFQVIAYLVKDLQPPDDATPSASAH